GRWIELPRRWNLQTADAAERGIAWAFWREDVERAIADPAMLHYTEVDKPWNAGTRHPYAARWYEALDLTAWSGWRPAGSRALHKRVGSRTRLAWHALVHGKVRPA